jgi:5'-nucleotidase
MTTRMTSGAQFWPGFSNATATATVVVEASPKEGRFASMDKPLALVDMDGTLCDFDAAMSRELARLKAPGEPDVSPYDESIPWIEARRDLVKSKQGFWLGLEKFKLGFDIYECLNEIGYKVHILTRGPTKMPEAWGEKVQWALQHLPGVPITLTHDKGLVYGKVLVDDWPKYIDAWLAHRPRGLVVMPAQFWNKGLYKDDRRVIRYDGTNLDEVRDRLTVQYQKATSLLHPDE